jgi:hypothetical protein
MQKENTFITTMYGVQGQCFFFQFGDVAEVAIIHKTI